MFGQAARGVLEVNSGQRLPRLACVAVKKQRLSRDTAAAPCADLALFAGSNSPGHRKQGGVKR